MIESALIFRQRRQTRPWSSRASLMEPATPSWEKFWCWGQVSGCGTCFWDSLRIFRLSVCSVQADSVSMVLCRSCVVVFQLPAKDLSKNHPDLQDQQRPDRDPLHKAKWIIQLHRNQLLRLTKQVLPYFLLQRPRKLPQKIQPNLLGEGRWPTLLVQFEPSIP